MKKILFIVMLMMSLSSVFAQFDQITCSNLVINTGNYQVSSFPEIKWLFLDPGLNTNIMYESVNPSGFVFSHPLQVSGVGNAFSGNIDVWNVTVRTNLTVTGTINYGGAIVWTTNNVAVTNATWANNVWWPTNVQTTTLDMNKAYADIDASVNPSFIVSSASLSTTNYQTAVVFVRNTKHWPTNGSADVLTLAIPSSNNGAPSKQGTFLCTNITVMTWFYDPNAPFTNVVSLPLY